VFFYLLLQEVLLSPAHCFSLPL